MVVAATFSHQHLLIWSVLGCVMNLIGWAGRSLFNVSRLSFDRRKFPANVASTTGRFDSRIVDWKFSWSTDLCCLLIIMGSCLSYRSATMLVATQNFQNRTIILRCLQMIMGSWSFRSHSSTTSLIAHQNFPDRTLIFVAFRWQRNGHLELSVISFQTSLIEFPCRCVSLIFRCDHVPRKRQEWLSWPGWAKIDEFSG